jgi:Raf kinase inhibitor-like YbhB/YbcL family protein
VRVSRSGGVNPELIPKGKENSFMTETPYDRLPSVPSFTLTSADVADGEPLEIAHYSGIFGVPGGADTSPQLSWSGAPAGTKSYVVSMYDPDAPIPSGFWHWALVDIPATTTELPSGAGDGANLPGGAFHVANEARSHRFLGAAPPPGSGKHRYFIAVNALDIDSVTDVGVSKDSTPAVLYFSIREHILARAVIAPWGGE